MSTTDFRYLYLRNANKFPVACIAYSVSLDKGTVVYGISTYNVRDEPSYDQRMARELAVGRAILNRQILFLPKGYHKLTDIIWLLMSHLDQNKGLPTRTRKAVKAWLTRTLKQEQARSRIAFVRDDDNNEAIELEPYGRSFSARDNF
jgi:hypothetical protein